MQTYLGKPTHSWDPETAGKHPGLLGPRRRVRRPETAHYLGRSKQECHLCCNVRHYIELPQVSPPSHRKAAKDYLHEAYHHSGPSTGESEESTREVGAYHPSLSPLGVILYSACLAHTRPWFGPGVKQTTE